MPKWDVTFRVTIDVDNRDIISILAKCYVLASIINDIPITPARQSKIDSLNILRAIRGTTAIEGAELSEDEVRRIMVAPKNKQVLPDNRQRDEKEARSADMLMKYVARLIKRNPNCVLDETLVSNFHKILTKNIEYENNKPGEYRTHPVRADDYIPPRDKEQVKGLMSGFITWFKEGQPAEWDPIIRAIVAHFYIVSIHPFDDGNGRTARAIESFLLYKAGINVRGFYSLANFYYKHRSEYIDYLNKVRFETENDLTPFVMFALKGLASELAEVHREVIVEVKEIAFRDFVREILTDRLGTKPGERMFNFMFELGNNVVNVKEIRDGMNPLSRLYRRLDPKTLSRDLAELKENQLIVIENGQVRANLDVMGKFTAYRELEE